MKQPTYRSVQALLLFLTLLVLAASFYFQYVLGLNPCPLCLMQRFCLFVFVLLCLTGICIPRQKGAKIGLLLQIVSAMLGFLFATRQLWLQSQPRGQAPACLPDLDMLFHYFPWSDILHTLLWGTGSCSEVAWRFLGLSMPAWSALYFLALLFGCGYLVWPLKKRVQEGAGK